MKKREREIEKGKGEKLIDLITFVSIHNDDSYTVHRKNSSTCCVIIIIIKHNVVSVVFI